MKIRQRFLSAILFVSMICLVVPFAEATGGVQSYSPNVRAMTQEKSNWCWAASSLMAGGYMVDYNTSCTQAELVEYLTGSATNNNYASIWQVANCVNYVTLQRYPTFTNYPFWFDFYRIQTSINNRRPVISLVEGSGSGHFYVIKGFYKDAYSENFYIINPGDGRTYTASYMDFQHGNTSNGWIDSRARTGDVLFKDWEG